MKKLSIYFSVLMLCVSLISLPVEANKKKKNRQKNKITHLKKEQSLLGQLVLRGDDSEDEKKVQKKIRGCGICCALNKIYEGSALVPAMVYYHIMLLLSERNAPQVYDSDYDSDVESTHEKARKILADSWNRIAH